MIFDVSFFEDVVSQLSISNLNSCFHGNSSMRQMKQNIWPMTKKK